MWVVTSKNQTTWSLSARETRPPLSSLAQRILTQLAKRQSYPREIATTLRVHEQKVYYHIKQLERLGLVRVVRKEERGGTIAKIYELTAPAFFYRFSDFSPAVRVPQADNSFMRPFVEHGKLNATIVTGSPDPHGPEKARSRDAYYGIDFGIFLGTFLIEPKESGVLDTDATPTILANNLILIGGPVINRVTRLVNDTLPIRFNKQKNVVSNLSKKTYTSDETGIIVKARNPFHKEKHILVIAGKRYSGTRAAILAFTRHFGDVQKGNKYKKSLEAKVVEGVDTNYDGVVDDVKILE